jgi:hypothetical protein
MPKTIDIIDSLIPAIKAPLLLRSWPEHQDLQDDQLMLLKSASQGTKVTSNSSHGSWAGLVPRKDGNSGIASHGICNNP